MRRDPLRSLTVGPLDMGVGAIASALHDVARGLAHAPGPRSLALETKHMNPMRETAPGGRHWITVAYLR